MSTSTAPTAAIRAALLAGEPWRCGLGRFSMVRVCSLKSQPQQRPPGAPARDPYGRPRFGSGAWWRPAFRASRSLRERLRDPQASLDGLASWEQDAVRTLRLGEGWLIPENGRLSSQQRGARLALRFEFEEALRLALGAGQQEDGPAG